MVGLQMGYELSISRGYEWAEDDSFSQITLDEWNQVIAEKGLEPIDEVEAMNPITKEIITIKTPNSAMRSTEGPIYSYRSGVITVQHNEESMDEYKEIALALGARIFGEAGESY